MNYPTFAGKYRSAAFTPAPISRTAVVQDTPRRTTMFDHAASRSTASTPVARAPERFAFAERHGPGAWAEREAKAKMVVHTVVPMHKGNYVLVTDPSLIPGMCSKPTGK